MVKRQLAEVAYITIPAGTVLYHGSNCAGDFDTPDGPAWFAHTEEKALFWANWGKNAVPTGKDKGPIRVFKYALTRNLTLYHTTTDEQWSAVCSSFTGYGEDVSESELARALSEFVGINGYYSEREVVLVSPWAGLTKGELVVQRDNSPD